MQIISGYARGIVLNVPITDTVRPTLARARKAMFDSLGPWNDRIVVDLFAGSGALGLEAASRGARAVFFYEKELKHKKCIESNILKVRKTGVESLLTVEQVDVMGLMKYPDDITDIFSDPPYDKSELFFTQFIGANNSEKIPQGVRLIWEIPEFESGAMKAFSGNQFWEITQLRIYGSTYFLILKKV